jgi:hypothetical protein
MSDWSYSIAFPRFDIVLLRSTLHKEGYAMWFTVNHLINRLQDLCLTVVVFGLMTIAACGGGNDGSKNSENAAPTAAITSPAGGVVYTYGDSITFKGSGNDAEDDALSGSSLVWTSDIDGQIGTGASFTRNNLSQGDHTISITATDGNTAKGIESVNISIKKWTYPTDLNDNISPDGQDAGHPWVAMDNIGNAIITWRQSDGSKDQIFKSEYRNGAWTHPASLTDNISPDGQDAYYPQVAIDNRGNAIITWYQNDGSNSQIFKSEYRNGVWSNPTGLTDNISLDGQDAYEPQVAMDNSGNAIVTWDQSDGSTFQTFKSEYR